MIDGEGFKLFLKDKGYSAAVVGDICSRAKRADKLKEWSSDELYLFQLEKDEAFQGFSVSVKSQIRKAVKLYNEYHSTTIKD